MTVTQYITTDGLFFAKRPVFPAAEMSGAITLTAGKKSVSDDFLGFGVAITGSSCYELSLMEPAERRAFLENIYTKEGIGLSVGRLSVGSSDYSAELYSYDDVENDTELKHFSIDHDRAYIIPIIKEILAVNPDLYLFASPWSPPAWMKTGNNLCGGFMREEYIDCYADYILRFLQEYAKCGIRISALTPQNETETQQHADMPACMWHPDIEARFARVLRKKLDENGFENVRIWIYDYNFGGYNRVKWSFDQHKWLSEACTDVAFHYYRGAIEDTLPLQAAYPELKLHFTEGGPRLYDNYSTDWCKWGIMMSKVLNQSYRSFTGWNLMLDETGGPNIGPFFCGGLVTRNSQDGALSYSGQYKAFRHIARFMHKGAKVLPLTLSDNNQGLFGYPKAAAPLQASLIENPDGTRIYFLINPADKKKQVQFAAGGSYHYVEMLPNTVSTVVVEP